MPNLVNCDISFTGKKLNLDELYARLDAINDAEELFNSILPMPAILRTFHVGYGKDFETGEEVRVWKEVQNGCDEDGNPRMVTTKIPKDEMDALVKEHGTASWYDWAVKNWGVKWDIPREEFNLYRGKSSVGLEFTSAWTFPGPFLEKLANDFGVRVCVRLSGEWDGAKRISFHPGDPQPMGS
jgi:hypothetical protein